MSDYEGGKLIQRRGADVPWLWRIKINGEMRTGETHTFNKKEAEAFAKAKRDELRHEARQNAKVGLGPLPFGLACDHFIADVVPTLSGDHHATLVNWLKAAVGPKVLCQDIRDANVMKVRARRAECEVQNTGRKISASTVNGTLNLFQWILTHARNNYGAALSPINWGKKKLPVNKREIRILENDETNRLVRAMRDDFHDVLCFLLACGKRVNEVLGLTWNDIRWERGVMTHHIKGGEHKHTPLGPIELEVLKRIMQLRSFSLVDGRTIDRAGKNVGKEPVFTFVAQVTRDYYSRTTKELVGSYVAGQRYRLLYGHLEDTLARICTEIKLEGVTIHVLRHTAATMVLRAQGVGGIAKAQLMLDHTNPATTMAFYAKVVDDDIRASKAEVAPKIAAQFHKLFAPRPPLKLVAG